MVSPAASAYEVVVVAPTESVAVTLKVTVPAPVGVPVMASTLVPLAGMAKPGMAPTILLTVSVLSPVPPVAVIVWL